MTAESDWNAWNIPTFFMNTAKTHNLIPQMPQITCLHYMFIDESGVENLVSDNKKKNLDSNWFTTGGVIVEAANVPKFEQVVDSIIKDCFIDRDIKLPSDFKLHYNSSRAKEHPYDQLPDDVRWSIADRIFDSINSIDCRLVSASIHKPSHAAKYNQPINMRAYTLLLCMERFQYFLQDVDDEGIIIYERLSTSLRRKMNREIKALRSIPNFPYFTKLDKIRDKIINGDPIKDKTLQFSDFFVYAPTHQDGNKPQKRNTMAGDQRQILFTVWGLEQARLCCIISGDSLGYPFRCP